MISPVQPSSLPTVDQNNALYAFASTRHTSVRTAATLRNNLPTNAKDDKRDGCMARWRSRLPDWNTTEAKDRTGDDASVLLKTVSEAESFPFLEGQ
jgi:hypothetical protein